MSQLFDSLPVYFKTPAMTEHQNENIFPQTVNGEVASLWHTLHYPMLLLAARLIFSKSERTLIS